MLSNLLYLSLSGFIALYLWLFIFITCALLFVLFLGVYIISLFSLCTVSVIDGL